MALHLVWEHHLSPLAFSQIPVDIVIILNDAYTSTQDKSSIQRLLIVPVMRLQGCFHLLQPFVSFLTQENQRQALKLK